MTDPTATFFAEIGSRGYEPLLRKASGTVRIDIVDGKQTERRVVAIDRGAISVSRKVRPCDGVIRVDRSVFERLASGELNPIAALLRGELAVEGDWRLLVLIQRLFPGPPKAMAGRRLGGDIKRRS